MTTFLQTKKYENIDNDYFWVKNIGIETSYFVLWANGTSNPSDVEYSYDKVNWNNLSTGSANIFLNPNQKCYVRAKNLVSINQGSCFHFSLNQCFSEVGGSVPALIDYEHKDSVTSIPDYYFDNFFENSSAINNIYLSSFVKNADKIDFGNITTVGNYGMYDMFSRCDLKIPPDLSSITTVGNNGMYNMFEYCTRLKSVPDLSSITTIGTNGMRQMFYNCPKLETGADLSSLTTIGDLGLANMYTGCVYMKEATYPNVSTYNQNATGEWLYDAGGSYTGTKTVYCPTGVVIPTDSNSGIPTGWTRVDY